MPLEELLPAGKLLAGKLLAGKLLAGKLLAGELLAELLVLLDEAFPLQPDTDAAMAAAAKRIAIFSFIKMILL